MATAATIAARLTLDTKNYDKGLDDAEKKGTAFQKKLGKIGKSMTKIGGIMTASLTLPIVAGMGKAVDAASDLEQATGAVNTVFGKSATVIEDFARTSAVSVGLARSEFKQLSAVTGSFLQNLGFDADQAADQTLILTQRASDMAAVFNTDVSQALEAIQSGLKGEFNPLEQFGVKINQAAINAKALEMGLAATKSGLDDNAKAQAALALVMEQTDRISGQFASESETFAVKMQVLKARFQDTAAELGQRLLPYAIDLLDWAGNMIDKFDALDEGSKDLIVTLGGITAALGPLVFIGGQVVNMLNGIITLLPKLATFATSAAGAISVMVAALAAEGVIQKKIFKNNMDTVDSISELNKEIASSTDSYDDYLKRVEEYNDSIYDQRSITGDLTANVSNAAKAINTFTKAEYEAAVANENVVGSLDSATRSMIAKGKAAIAVAEEHAAAIRAQQDAMQSAKFEAYLSLTENYTDTLDTLNGKQEELNDLLKLQSEQGSGVYQGTWYSARQLEEKIGDVKGEISGLESQMSSSANQMVLDMAMTQAAVDGIITPEEFQQIQDLGVALGEFSEEAANKAIEEFDRAYNVWQKLKFDDKQVTVRVNLEGIGSAAIGGSQSLNLSTSSAEDQATGGFYQTNSPTLFQPSEHGQQETSIFVPKNKTLYDVATAQQLASVLPKGGDRGNVVTLRPQNTLTQQDKNDLAAAIKDALLTMVQG